MEAKPRIRVAYRKEATINVGGVAELIYGHYGALNKALVFLGAKRLHEMKRLAISGDYTKYRVIYGC